MKICIVGVGHMGAWLAGELTGDGHEVALLEKYREKLKNPLYHVMKSKSDIKAFNPDMLINAVPLENTIDVFKDIIEEIHEGCTVVDVASVKSGLNEFYAEITHPFVSVHPMFGPTFGDMEIVSQENAVIISESDDTGKKFFNDFFHQRHITVFDYSFRIHDEMMAYSLSLPFVSTLVFAACMRREAVPGTTFKKHKLIAEGLLSEDDSLLSEILFNRFTLEQLEKVTSKLEFLKHVIQAKDSEESSVFFNNLRDNLSLLENMEN